MNKINKLILNQMNYSIFNRIFREKQINRTYTELNELLNILIGNWDKQI